MVDRRSQECERMRGSISAALDGELSEFESMRLGSHLDDCDSGREFEAWARFSSTTLRAAPLEPLSRPVALPSRRRIAFPAPVPAAAAAAVLMVVFGGVFESLHGGSAIRGAPAQAAFNNRLDMRAMAKRQELANF